MSIQPSLSLGTAFGAIGIFAQTASTTTTNPTLRSSPIPPADPPQHLPLHLRKSRCEQIDELPQRPRLLQRAPHRSRHRIEVVVRVSGRDGGEKGSRRPDEPRCRGRGRKGAASWVDVRYAEVGRMPRSDFAANNIGRGRHCGVAQAETARALDHRDQPVELIRRRHGIGEVLQDQLAGAGETSRNTQARTPNGPAVHV